MRNETLRFLSFDLQPSGFVRPSAILRRMQQCAREDLDSFGVTYEDMREKNMAFVVSKMALVFSRPVKGEISMQLQSAANETHGATFPRSFVLSDAEGVCMRAMSLWALLDFEKRSLLRASAFGCDLPFFDDLSEGVQCMRLFKPKEQSPFATDTRRVYASMLDQNNHLNNCNYADLATDLLPIGQVEIREMHLTFQHEARLGDLLTLAAYESDGGFLVVGEKEADQTPIFLCHVKTF